jgi:RNA polymerase sigma factor (sigma-70 family)
MEPLRTSLFDERLLLHKLGRGDAEAFWSLWMLHRVHLYRVCLRLMRGVPADAADAMSRSMLTAFAKLPAHAFGIENLQAWLTRLTRNVCIDIRRERHRHTVGYLPVDEAAVMELIPVDPHPSPEAEALANETFVTIHRAIEDLPPLVRDVARLRFLDEASYDSIASKLSITEPTARKRVQQARTLLRTHGLSRRVSA